MEAHSTELKNLLKQFNSTKDGLSRFHYLQNKRKYGLNELTKEKKINAWEVLVSQFKGLLIYILFGAVVISALLGEWVDAIVILLILIINGVVGFIQEYKAEKSIEALQRLASLHAKVIRDGKQIIIDVKDVVPGDVVLIETGDKIPADSRIIEATHFETQEASLTGESLPVKKGLGVLKEDAPLSSRSNMVFSGTVVTHGHAKALVVATGMQTEIGHIAKMVQGQGQKKTPLQKKLAVFSKKLGIGAIALCLVVFIVAAIRWGNPLEMFITALALAVAAIPEGLPIVVTIALALGTKRMLKKNALMRRLSSVETLGSVTVICSDKTGTFTKNEMTVKKIFVNNKVIEVTGSGYKAFGDFLHNNKKIDPKALKLLLMAGVLNNNSNFDKEKVIGDPTEACLLVSAKKAGLNINQINKKYPRVDEIEFTSERKFMTTIHKTGKKRVVFMKGAPDVVIKKCNRIIINGKIKKLTLAQKDKLLEMNKEFASQALRVLSFAYKDKGHHSKDEEQLVFIGLQAMIDPPREEVKGAVARCNQAGIRVVMITGDGQDTAIAIAEDVGIRGKCVTGADIDKLNLVQEANNISIYARVNPAHKMQIIEALQKRNHIVAMTGDGVNDAPALKKADIGIAMGITGTDVSKESADMVLVDDNFSSIVNAIEEGRTIFDNIRKFIIYLLSSNLGEVLTLFVGIILGLPLPLIALQILWINIATDGLPALALGVEGAEEEIMKRKPRNPKNRLVNLSAASYMLFLGLIMAIGTLGMFYFYLVKNGWQFGEFLSRDSALYVYATSIAFTTLMMFQMFNVINCKTLKESVFKKGLLSNVWLLVAIVISVLLQFIVLYTPLSKVFHTTAIGLFDWILIIVVTSSVLWFGELFKFIRLRLLRGEV
ncbi:calcium-translocating P-type ATPase, SERCA-type [Candidatus Woesearchaeota archaeon]|jgi:P-type Ca2+ transporter type 2C|nr:calcium-translocating P-type ATPase, SERCA-type [Candidatus Woesearchaeota archaeon]MBT5272845.1 calcium-translocating P-type ATPase, SERCA-type [Candidatus Woesearchaeota archaeon]MBT6040457.1 calcium-translocating P-type ATPase, SERCA-type [Candidatus Woesearchaeota archaeon]MBT6336464.1 calcium-translocating P-type ATPase, SERCA-type [Candidatus Woesearchaeota archaeon]MBT7927968.1 calcium-translocating P-type ATPase, SERCA-type [Candidatus Woesearchaeota archaeon]